MFFSITLLCSVAEMVVPDMVDEETAHALLACTEAAALIHQLLLEFSALPVEVGARGADFHSPSGSRSCGM